MLEQGLSQFPDSESLILFKALTLHAMGRGDAAMGSMLTLVADRLRTDEILRYEAAIRGNGAYLTSRG